MHKVAIITLSFNCLEDTTKPCLESIFSCKNETPFIVVVVDNLSTDGTREYLIEEEKKHDNLRVILNDRNTGYAAGNNIGIGAAEAEYYILLNNDTIVTDYWIDYFVRFFSEHPETGMLGPVTNSVGNEQLIHIESTKEAEIIHKGLEWAATCKTDYFYTKMLGFFCVAIKKEVIDTVGLLEEAFGIGMFEDDDYCLRVREKGYNLACLEDIFIFHKGNFTFKNTIADYNDLFYINLRKFEEKHHTKWRTGCSTPPFLDLFDSYMANSSGKVDKALYKIKNKLQVMRRFDYPRFNLEYLVSHQQEQISKLEEKTARADKSFHESTAEDIYVNLQIAENELKSIHSSLTWRLAKRLHRIIDKLPITRPAYNFLHSRLHSKAGFVSTTTPSNPAEIAITESAVVNTPLEYLRQNPQIPIVVFPPLFDWDVPLFQRPQQIAMSLAKNGLYYFYCTPNAKYDSVEGFTPISSKGFLTNKFEEIITLPNRKVIHLISTDNSKSRSYVEEELRKGNLILYEYIDEIHEKISGIAIPQSTIEMHEYILRSEQCTVIATADKLYKDVLEYRSGNCALVTNGVDYDHFSRQFTGEDIPNEIKHIVARKKPIIGYFGAFASWFDFDAVASLAKTQPDYEILLIGWNYQDLFDVSEIQKLPNVTVIGPIPYKELPRYAFWFDVSTIPFIINEITESTSPIKLFEYMALGKPIVTTDLPECRRYKSVLIAKDHSDFIVKIRMAIDLKFDLSYKMLLEREASENTWDSKAKIIYNLIHSNLAR